MPPLIGEEMMDLLGTPGRKSVSPMDLVAVLTKGVQPHRQKIAALEEKPLAMEAQDRE